MLKHAALLVVCAILSPGCTDSGAARSRELDVIEAICPERLFVPPVEVLPAQQTTTPVHIGKITLWLATPVESVQTDRGKARIVLQGGAVLSVGPPGRVEDAYSGFSTALALAQTIRKPADQLAAMTRREFSDYKERLRRRAENDLMCGDLMFITDGEVGAMYYSQDPSNFLVYVWDQRAGREYAIHADDVPAGQENLRTEVLRSVIRPTAAEQP